MINVYRLNWINTEARLERERAEREAAEARFEQAQARERRRRLLWVPVAIATAPLLVTYVAGRLAVEAWRAR